MIIQLTKGQSTVVDDEDYEELSRFKWCSHFGRHTWYAVRGEATGVPKKRRLVFMHRMLLGTPGGSYTDHIDGDGLNNRRANLRIVSTTENAHNQTRKRPKASSRFRGVSWDNWTQRWRATIQVTGRLMHIGRFDSEEEAALAYNAAGFARDPRHFTPNVVA